MNKNTERKIVKNVRVPIYVILDNIRSALNVGAIFRTCDATNIEKLLLCGITAYPPHNRIPKTALGSTESVPWKHYTSTIEAVNQCNNASIVSVELTDNAVNYWDYSFTRPTAIVFGNEITGVDPGILEQSDAVIKVPMYGMKTSLNVATTVGVVLYEMLRQFNI